MFVRFVLSALLAGKDHVNADVKITICAGAVRIAFPALIRSDSLPMGKNGDTGPSLSVPWFGCDWIPPKVENLHRSTASHRTTPPPFSQFSATFPRPHTWLLPQEIISPIFNQIVTMMGATTNGTAKSSFLFTSESVGEGHPDKIA